MIYGVDSIMPANTKLTNGYLLYDWVMRKSCFPSFWGRSISGAGAINKEEIDFLRSKIAKLYAQSEISMKLKSPAMTALTMQTKPYKQLKALEYQKIKGLLCLPKYRLIGA